MRRVLLGALGALLASCGVLAGPTEAHAATAFPECSRAPLGGLSYRLYLDPGDVVTGDVVSVRSGSVEWTERPNGTWVSRQVIDPLVKPYVHVVIKSDAAAFSDRRYSSWVTCKPVQP